MMFCPSNLLLFCTYLIKTQILLLSAKNNEQLALSVVLQYFWKYRQLKPLLNRLRNGVGGQLLPSAKHIKTKNSLQ